MTNDNAKVVLGFMELHLHTFKSTSVLDGAEGIDSKKVFTSIETTSSIHWTGNWLVPIAGLCSVILASAGCAFVMVTKHISHVK